MTLAALLAKHLGLLAVWTEKLVGLLAVLPVMPIDSLDGWPQKHYDLLHHDPRYSEVQG